MKFKFVKGPTSDIKFEAYGKDAKELFENAALAVCSVMCDIRRVKPSRSIEAEVDGKDMQDMLFNWLNYVIALVDIQNMFFSAFRVSELSNMKLKAVCSGEYAKPENSITVVKSVTYHDFRLEKTKSGYKTTVVLDI